MSHLEIQNPSVKCGLSHLRTWNPLSRRGGEMEPSSAFSFSPVRHPVLRSLAKGEVPFDDGGSSFSLSRPRFATANVSYWANFAVKHWSPPFPRGRLLLPRLTIPVLRHPRSKPPPDSCAFVSIGGELPNDVTVYGSRYGSILRIKPLILPSFLRFTDLIPPLSCPTTGFAAFFVTMRSLRLKKT